MKKYEILRISDILIKSINYKNHEFAYAVFKNKQLVDNALLEVDFMNDVEPEYIEYENKRLELCKKTCRKDQNGMDIVNDGRFDIEDTESFKDGMDKLRTQYLQFIDRRDEQINRFNTIMQGDIELNFIKVDKNDLPKEISTAAEMFEYEFMIK